MSSNSLTPCSPSFQRTYLICDAGGGSVTVVEGKDREAGVYRSMTRRSALFVPVAAAFGMEGRVRLVPSMKLSFVGLGPVRIGMTEAQVRGVVAGEMESTRDVSEEDCYYLILKGRGLGFMILHSRLARIDVMSGEWRTQSGAHIGSTEDEIRKLYGAAVQEVQHHYDPQGKYMSVSPQEGAYKGFEVLFETDGKVVTNFRAGTVEAVPLVEGCS
jgi:hypothetical protein